jgi:hypothetical protein
MTRQEWWRYVREDRLGLTLAVVMVAFAVWAFVTGHLL